MRFCKYIKLSIILFILGYIGMMSRLTIYGEENIQLELVSDKSEIQSGEEVQVQLNLIRGEYLAGMSVWVGYDDNVLEVVSAETSKEVLFPATVNPNGKKDGKSFVGYSYASADGTTESGTILTIKFKVLENITQDETEIRAIRSDAATSKSETDITAVGVVVSPITLTIGGKQSGSDKLNPDISNKGKSNTNDKSSQSVSKTKDKKTNDKNNSDNKNEKSDKTDNNSNNTNEKTKSDSNSNTETDNKQNNTTKIDIDKENSETGTVKGEKKEISERTDDSETQTNHIDTKNIEKKINNKKENKTAIWKILGILIAVIVIAGSVALLIYKKREDK